MVLSPLSALAADTVVVAVEAVWIRTDDVEPSVLDVTAVEVRWMRRDADPWV
jgi:hypothetical protein